MWHLIPKFVNSHYLRILCAKFGWYRLTVVNAFSSCGQYPPLGKFIAFKFNKFEFPLSKNTWSCLDEIGLLVLEKIFKRWCQYIFNMLLLSSLNKGKVLYLKKNLNPLNPKMFCAKFGWNWPSGSGEEVVNVFSQCIYYLSLTKGMALHLNKLESSSMLYVRYGGTWLISVKIWMDTWTDGQTDRQTARQETGVLKA